MEVIDVFNVSAMAASKIRAILSAEEPEPNAGVFPATTILAARPRNSSTVLPHTSALAVNSGTSALIASLVAAGVGPSEEVIVPAYTFFASV